MSSLPKPTAESQGDTPLEKASTEGFAPGPELAAAAHWHTPFKFAVHACVGSMMFVIVAVPAILLDWGMTWAEAIRGTDPLITLGLSVAAHALFGPDLALFLVFLLRTFKRTIRLL